MLGIFRQLVSRSGQVDGAAGAFQQTDVGLLLEQSQLLRDGGGRDAAQFGHGRHRAVGSQVAQEDESSDIER